MEMHLKEITDKLSSVGTPISEEDQVVTPLGSLPLIQQRSKLEAKTYNWIMSNKL